MKRLSSPSRLSFEQREGKILEAAAALFSEKGYRGTTTKAIAEKARVNEALLFRHFTNKESLYTALLRKNLSRGFLHVIPILEKTLKEPLLEGLLKIAKTLILEHRKDPRIHRMMLYSALEGHRQGRLIFRERLPFVEFLERFLAEKKERGEVKSIDPPVATRCFLGMIYNYILVTQIFQAKNFYPKRENEMLESYVKIFTQGISS
jgi:TetR/AcrR family transcriptional regulator